MPSLPQERAAESTDALDKAIQEREDALRLLQTAQEKSKTSCLGKRHL